MPAGSALYGIEISESGIEITRNRPIPRLAECILFDGYTIPYPDGRFDLAVLSHVIEHVEYPRRLLREAARVARHVFIETPLEDNLFLHDDLRRDTTGHINFFNYTTIRKLVRTSGLDIVSNVVRNASYSIYRHTYGRAGALVYLPKEIAVRLMPRFAPRLITFHSALLCRKKPTNPEG